MSPIVVEKCRAVGTDFISFAIKHTGMQHKNTEQETALTNFVLFCMKQHDFKPRIKPGTVKNKDTTLVYSC